MSKLKSAIAWLFYVASCMTLLIAPAYLSLSLGLFAADASLLRASSVPAFTNAVMQVLPHGSAICYATLAVSILLAFMVRRKARERDARLYWIGVLSNINFYIAMLLFGAALIGLFVLPKIANGA